MKRSLPLMLCFLLLTAVACQGADEDEEAPPASIEIIAPADEAVIKGNVIELKLKSSGVKIAKADGKRSQSTGHYHVFVDVSPVGIGDLIPQADGIFHSATETVLIPGLSQGEHDIVAVFGDGAHYRISSAEAAAFIEVEGPTLNVEGPSEIASGEELKLEIETEGFVGEFLVLVDPSKVPSPGQALTPGEKDVRTKETTATISGLAAGEHTIWVVAVGDDGIPVSPLVSDRIVVQVK